MCGIAGIVAIRPTLRIKKPLLERMASAIAHRIVDVEHGSQPMSNEDETVWISFNGKIYNHADYRARLEASGHRLTTCPDTEIVRCKFILGIVHLEATMRRDEQRIV